MLRSSLFVLSLVLTSCLIASGEDAKTQVKYATVSGIDYRDEDVPNGTKCRLDLYYPTDRQGFTTVVWFHGGGLTGGKRDIPKALREQGIAVVGVDYRLSPHVKVADCIDDAAASVAWTFRNIANYGGSPQSICVSGHSAGGYLTSMIGLDKRWLAKYDIDADRIAALIPFSGHTITHFTARKEQGIDGKQPVIDALAPLFHVRGDAPPTLLITGDRDLEMLGRYEENAYFWRMMKVAGHRQIELMELDGYNHGQMAEPAFPILLRFIKTQHAVEPKSR